MLEIRNLWLIVPVDRHQPQTSTHLIPVLSMRQRAKQHLLPPAGNTVVEACKGHQRTATALADWCWSDGSEMLCKELFHLQANLQKWHEQSKTVSRTSTSWGGSICTLTKYSIRSFHTLTVPTMIYDKHWKGLLPVELMHRWPRLPNTKSPSFVCVRDIKPQAPERLPQRVQWRAAVRRWCQLHSAGSLHFRMANLRRHRFLYKAHLEASKSWPSAEWCV